MHRIKKKCDSGNSEQIQNVGAINDIKHIGYKFIFDENIYLVESLTNWMQNSFHVQKKRSKGDF